MQSHLLCTAAVLYNPVSGIFGNSVPVKADRNFNTSAADNVLLFLILEKLQHIRMLTVTVDRIVADVHLPEDAALPHFHKIRIGVFPA